MLVTHKKTQENILEKPTAERERERKTPDDRLSYIHKFVGVWDADKRIAQ